MEKPDRPSIQQRLPKQSSFRKWLFLSWLKIRRCYGEGYGGIWKLPGIVLKYGPYELSEAETMHYIRINTSIPVPKLYCAFVHRGRTYMAMERVKGSTLCRAWHREISEQEKQSILAQLRLYLDELRSLKPPEPDKIGSVNYGPLNDKRFQVEPFGPFESVHRLQQILGTIYVLDRAITAASSEEEVQWAQKMKEKTWDIRLTHGDLNSYNVLVDKGRIAAILDWERSGWLPEYYEYTNACSVAITDQWWRPYMDQILDPYPEALKMDNMRRDVFTVF